MLQLWAELRSEIEKGNEIRTVVEADGVVSGVVRDAEVKDPDTVVEALEDGPFLSLEDACRGYVPGGGRVIDELVRMNRENETHEPV